MASIDAPISDTLAFSDKLTRLLDSPEIDDLLGIVVSLDVTKTTPMALADTLIVTSAVSSMPGIIITDRLGVHDAATANSIMHPVVLDQLMLRDTLGSAELVIIADTISFSDAVSRQVGVLLADRIGLADVWSGAATYRRSISDRLQLADNLAKFVGGEIVDTLALADALDRHVQARPVLADTLGLSDTITPSLVIRAVISDTLELTDSQAVQALYQGLIEDIIELSVGYVAPDGSFTTWAMNTRTAAVSEYQNYAFNSFGRIGNRYIGASSSGLYWLDGDDDAGDPIVARMRGGFLQFGGTHLSRLKAAYIATRGDAEFVLRIETGDGELYNYAVSTRSMRSTKVHMGKGQRARYFTYELISAGADFDLDSLEFVPIVVQRRV